MLFDYYREVVTPEQGIEYFDIFPSQAQNIVSIASVA